MTVFFKEGVLLRLFEVVRDHLGEHFFDGDFRDPAEVFFCFGRVSEKSLDFGRAEVAGVDFDDNVADFDGR